MRLAILGASGHGKVVADASEMAGWLRVDFYDDAWPNLTHNGPWRVIGDTSALLRELGSFDGVIVAIGDNSVRAKRQSELVAGGGRLVSIVHPRAVISRHCVVGPGSVLLANSVVNAGAKVGEGCIVNTEAVIEHDCVLGDFVHISPGAVLSGGVEVGRLTWIGASAAVRQMIKVGERAIVGMGGVVTKDVPSGATVVGNPATILNAY